MDRDALIRLLQSYHGSDRMHAVDVFALIEGHIRADERAACIALVYGHAGSDNDAQRIVDAIRARDATTP
jgi:hypothetical protein